MRVKLKRFPSSDEGTFGSIRIDTGVPFSSIELPWRDNHPRYSCIPVGNYHCVWAYSPKLLRYCFHVEDVPARSEILFHAINWAGDVTRGLKSDSEGCIGVGMRIGAMGGQRALLNAGSAISLFEKELGYHDFDLSITSDDTSQ
jgi:hypothetical protein